MTYNHFIFSVAQNRVSAYWFEGKELAFAFGATLSFSRMVNFPFSMLLISIINYT